MKCCVCKLEQTGKGDARGRGRVTRCKQPELVEVVEVVEEKVPGVAAELLL